jgi:hypothetical protein
MIGGSPNEPLSQFKNPIFTVALLETLMLSPQQNSYTFNSLILQRAAQIMHSAVLQSHFLDVTTNINKHQAVVILSDKYFYYAAIIYFILQYAFIYFA